MEIGLNFAHRSLMEPPKILPKPSGTDFGSHLGSQNGPREAQIAQLASLELIGGPPMAPHRWHRSGEEFSYFSIRRGTHAPMAPLKAENTDPENPYICHSPASEWRGTSLEPGLVPV